MKKSSIIWLSVAAVAFIIVGYSFSTYNHLVTANEQATAQWKQVETQYQRRFDLIPNLVEAAKGIMKQEQTIFTALADARTRYAGAQASGSVNEKVAATANLDGALSRLLVITENYPVLKSSDNVQTLMSQLEGTENRIAVERSRFNESVQAYNLIVKRAPSSLIASLFSFAPRTYFEVDAKASTAPEVKF
jgi:LemA protein